MDVTKKIQPGLLAKADAGGAESYGFLPVYIETTKVSDRLLEFLQNTRVRIRKRDSVLILGKVKKNQLRGVAGLQEVKFVMDREMEVPPPPLPEHMIPLAGARTDVRGLVLNPKKEEMPLDENCLRGAGIKAAIIDTAADVNHADIKDAVVKVADCTRDGDFRDGDRVHATHVGGIVNQVAPEAALYFYKIFPAQGICIAEYIVDAIAEAIEDRVDVINGSWGHSGCSGGCPIDYAVSAAVERGIMFCGSAGNSGPDRSSLTCPAGNTEITTAAACTMAGRIADFSSRGPSYKDGSMKPDISAPGVDVVSCYPGGGYQVLSGTSMASPGVAGSYAAVKSGLRYLSSQLGTLADLEPVAIKQAFIKSGKDLGHDKYEQGAGLISITGAVNMLIKEHGLKKPSRIPVSPIFRYAALAAAVVFAVLFFRENLYDSFSQSQWNLFPDKGAAIAAAVGEREEMMPGTSAAVQAEGLPLDLNLQSKERQGEDGGTGKSMAAPMGHADSTKKGPKEGKFREDPQLADMMLADIFAMLHEAGQVFESTED